MFGLFENQVSKLMKFAALQSLFLVVLFLLKTYNYNLFHIIAEGYSIVVALCIFFIVVNSQEYQSNNFISLLTSGFVATVAIDVLHTLAFRGMNIFDGYDTNLPTQLWILARYISSITLLIAVLMFEKKVRLSVAYALYLSITAIAITAIFAGEFPDAFIAGTGLTTFKIVSEYIIIAIIAIALFLLSKKKDKFDPSTYANLCLSYSFAILSEWMFTLYGDPFDLLNLLGHYFKILSVYFIYKAVIQIAVTYPQKIIFRELELKKQDLEREVQDSILKMREHASFLHSLINAIPVPVFYKDTEGRYLGVNKTFEEFYGKTEQDMVGKSVFDIAPLEFAQVYHAKDVELFRTKAVQVYEGQLKNGQGVVRDVVYHKAAFTDLDGNVRGLIGTFLDVTERKKREEEVLFLSLHDLQTGLLNRNALRKLSMDNDNDLEQDKKQSVLFMDIDNFRIVNDAIGHSMGDQMINELAGKIKACVSDRGVVYRGEGDEFIIFVESTDAELIRQLAAELLQVISSQIIFNSRSFFITASIGICIGKRGENIDLIIKHADTALYVAKKQKNTIAIYTPAMDYSKTRETILEEDMQGAIENDEFELHYQPIIDIRTGDINQAEALLRWNHPELGRISPAEFIPIAERTKLIIAISDWVVQQSCAKLAEWATLGIHNLTVSVNLSVLCVENRGDHLAEFIMDAVKTAGVNPANLKLEITESVLMSDFNEIRQVFQKLRDFGVKLALDDFGTGYSSFGYMKDLPLDIVKLDRSLINGADTDDRAQMIVHSMITIMHGLDIEVVAEGVETVEQLEILRKYSCDYVQGFLFSRPLHSEQFVEYYFAMKEPGQAEHCARQPKQ